MFQKLRKNGLSPSHVIWDLQHVYMNDITREMQFIYMPFENAGNRTSLIEFVDRVIHSAVPAANEDSKYMTDKPRDYYAHYSGDEDATTILIDEESTTLLVEEEDEEGTVLLDGGGQEKLPILYRVSTEEKIRIQKSVFRIGTKRGDADYSVDNNQAVSRNHAEVIRREDRCFIKDLDSMNKTYVNGQMIPARQETEIYDGDSLKLADEEFILYF